VRIFIKKTIRQGKFLEKFPISEIITRQERNNRQKIFPEKQGFRQSHVRYYVLCSNVIPVRTSVRGKERFFAVFGKTQFQKSS